MTATAAQIATVRRLTNEPDSTTYTDGAIQAVIEGFPCLDERGEQPYSWDTSYTPPVKEDNVNWVPTYDLNAAAAAIWDEKASVVAQDFDFSADGGSYKRSQVYDQYSKMARRYASKRKPSTITLWPSPRPPSEVINQNVA
jgi:hypothetical protein